MATLYTPYKAIGFVCDSVPFEINRLGEEIFLTTAIGNCFQVFRFNKLTSCLVSKTAPGGIQSLKVNGDETYVAVDKSVVVYKRSSIVNTYTSHSRKITGLSLVGSILLSYDDSNTITLTDTKARSVVGEIKVMQQATISSIVHPATYINKVLIGYGNGQMELWNINKKVLIYSFASHLQYFKAKGASISAITTIEQSPACDVIAVGFSSGDLLLLNMKLDQVLFGFAQSSGVTSLSFRTDSKAKNYPYLVSGAANGAINIWNLGNSNSTADETTSGSKMLRSLQSSLDDAHKGNVSRVSFLPGEPIMVSSGEDNCVKVWIFDSPDGSARLHSSRDGHNGCPSKIRYYGGTSQVSMRDNADATSCEIVSAGSDGSLRLFNTALSNQNREFSQKPIIKSLGFRKNELLPKCIDFDFSENRERHWGNMVSIHENMSSAFLWRYKQRVVTEVILKPPADKPNKTDIASHCSSVAFSLCGNFCVVGYRSGAVYKYNVQSGLCRGGYPKNGVNALKAGTIVQRAKVPANVLYSESPAAIAGLAMTTTVSSGSSKINPEGHTQDVTGVFVDMTNSTLVTCGLDGLLLFWDFSNQTLLHQVKLDSPLLLMQGFRDANFVAVADQQRTVSLFDIHSFKLIRKFSGHLQQITDISFSPDGRRILTSSMDSTVRVWEISTARCLSWLKFSRPILSIAMSLSGEYLCVAQSDKNGIFMYADRSLFESVHFWKEPSVPTLIEDSELIDEDNTDEIVVADSRESSEVVTPESDVADAIAETDFLEFTKLRNSEDDVSFSTCPRVFWSSLFHLEVIKERNKLATPVSITPTAPFFLPTVVRGGSTMAFPTQMEYTKMLSDQKRPLLAEGLTDDVFFPSSKTAKVETENKGETTFDDLAAMKSAWDDDDAGGFGSISDPAVESVAVVKKTNSRILSSANLPRCKLMSHLQTSNDSTNDSVVLEFLKSLSAPAVDIEITALCTSSIEMEESHVVADWLHWLSRMVSCGRDFELIQAYLHRTLAVYSELILKSPSDSLVHDIKTLNTSNQEMSVNFRSNIQRNLCMLKVLANIPLS